MKKLPAKLQHGTCNFWRVIAFTRSFDIRLYWKFKKVTQRSTSNLAEILMRITSLPIKLQHGAGKFWGIIIFTRSYKMLKRSKRLDKSQHQTCLRFWGGEYFCNVTIWCMQLLRTYHVLKTTWPWTSLKVHEGHTKVNVKLVQDFDVENIPINLQHHKAIYEELSCSQGSGHYPPSVCLPAQAMTIPLQPKGAEG